MGNTHAHSLMKIDITPMKGTKHTFWPNGQDLKQQYSAEAKAETRYHHHRMIF